MKTLLGALFGVLILPALAFAQASPNFFTGQVPTANQWNSYFVGKADATNGTLTNPTITGGTANGITINSPIITAATITGFIPTGGAALDLGAAQGQIVGAWPYLSLAPSPVLTGQPVVAGPVGGAQLEFIRGGTRYTFIGSTSSVVGISSSENLPFVVALNGFQTFFYIDPQFGNIGVGTTTPHARLDVNAQAMILEQPFTPLHNTTTCTTGTITWDTAYVYVCTSTNSWHRSIYTAGTW